MEQVGPAGVAMVKRQQRHAVCCCCCYLLFMATTLCFQEEHLRCNKLKEANWNGEWERGREKFVFTAEQLQSNFGVIEIEELVIGVKKKNKKKKVEIFNGCSSWLIARPRYKLPKIKGKVPQVCKFLKEGGKKIHLGSRWNCHLFQ